MAWRGTLRTIIAAQRAAERARVRHQRQAFREYTQQQRFSAREQARYQKELQLREAQEEVEAFEKHLEWLSLHNEIPATFDWHDVLNAEPPAEPLRRTEHEDRARQQLANYAPGLIDRATGQAKQKTEELNAAVISGYEEDEKIQQRALKEHKKDLIEWRRMRDIAQGVLELRPENYLDALKESGFLSDVDEIGKYLECTVDRDTPDFLEASLFLHEDDIVPSETKSLLKTGKLSIKKMPPTRFNQLYQDYVCSCLFRLALEVFALLPAKVLLLHAKANLLNTATGHMEWQTAVSVAVPIDTLRQLNIPELDPSDALKNFVHQIKFSKTGGFTPVAQLKPEDIGIQIGSPLQGELIPIRQEEEEKNISSPGLPPPLLIERSKGSNLFGCLAALIIVPIAVVGAITSLTFGLVASVFGLILGSLLIVDSNLKRQGMNKAGIGLVLLCLANGGLSFGINAHKEEQARLKAEQEKLEQKIQDESQAQFAKGKEMLQRGDLQAATASFQKSADLLSSNNDAQVLLKQCKSAGSPYAKNEVLMSLSDQEFLIFRKTQKIPSVQYYDNEQVNRAFITSFKDLDSTSVAGIAKARQVKHAAEIEAARQREKEEAAMRQREAEERAQLKRQQALERQAQQNQTVYVTRTDQNITAPVAAI